MPKVLLLVAFALLATEAPAGAHYNMLLPSSASGKKGEAVTFTYQWGHPYEHQLFDAPKPESVVVRAPDGKTEDLTKTLEKVALPAGEGKTVTGFRFKFTPGERGDYLFLLKTPPIFREEDGDFVQDQVKVIYHVQAQKGWDASIEGGFEWEALTRPYGLEPGMVFHGTPGHHGGQPPGSSSSGSSSNARRPADVTKTKYVGGLLVEVERYNPTPPKKLPPDEHITRVVKTDGSGVAACTLLESGWWCLTAQDNHIAKRQHDGKDYPLHERSTLWVFVDEKPGR